MSFIQKRGQNTTWRNNLMRNLVTELIVHGQLEIIEVRAKEVQKHADKMITLAKEGSLHSRRQALAYLRDIKDKNGISAIDILFTKIAEKYKDRNGGYTQVIKTENRRGDSTQMAIIRLV
ncbi:50S ribosomal protein L17 [Mycoplasma sp. (ex Biomphalaria glabrata)]|uniref:50S ribosomal protein L17 n=1 Tax=Mycoplasma sp. (ex Biomphalaria glabrata) TaxID=1749074 RepID=UPI00073AAAF8|nr:50S ribosomal protein L17 [Mycoplasma sp. (ex Biomphalaria glabrata)]ALV23412.1 50S ribosomal protein L17 [Mycoplasma sp. (ex Biomphalaria glabrata)]